MIKFNNSNIIDWNFDDSNIIKVYHNGAVVFYKFDSEQGGYKVCFAVVDDITQYQETEFEDVYDKATEKWYKLNNLNQYEEYGVYASGRTSCEGSTSRLPQGYTEVEYVENIGTSYINTGVYLYDTTTTSYEIDTKISSSWHNSEFEYLIATEGTSSPYNGVELRWSTHYQSGNELQCESVPKNVVYSNIDNGDGTSAVTITCSATQATNNVPLSLFCGIWTSGPWRNGKGKFYTFKVTKNNTLVRDLVPAKRDSDSVYGLYDLINDVFYTSPNGNNFIGGDPVTPTDCVTTYEGKLTIDDGYEYEWNGSSWVNLGEVSGSSRVPVGYTEVEYIETDKTQYIDTGIYLNTSNFEVGYTIVGNSSCWGYCHQNVANGTWLGVESTTAWYGRWSSNTTHKVDMSSYLSSENNTIVYKQNGVTINGSTVSKSLTMGSDSIANKSLLFFGRYDFYKGGVIWQNNFKAKSLYIKNNGELVRDFVPAKRDSDSVYGLYDLINDVFYTSPNGNNFIGGGPVTPTEYPKYYDEKSEPLDNLTFNTLADAQAYAEANCVYDGMHATINGYRYYFDSSDENGWVKILEYYKFEDVTPSGASGWTISGSSIYNPDSSYYDDFDLQTTSTSNVTKIAKVTIYGYDHFTYYLRTSGYSNYCYAVATNVDEVSTPPSTMGYSSLSAITHTYYWNKSPKSAVNLSNYRRVTYNNLDKTVEHTFYVYFYGRTYSRYVGNATILIPKQQTNENWEQVTFSASSNVASTTKNLYIDGNYSTSGGTQYWYHRWMVGLPSESHTSYTNYSDYSYCPNVTSSTFTSVAGEQRQVNFTYDNTTNKTLSFRLTDGSNVLTPSNTVYYNMTYYNSCGVSSSTSNVTFPRSQSVKVGGRFRFANSSNRHYIYGYSPNISLNTDYYVNNYQSTFDITYTKLSDEAVTITYTAYDPNDSETPAFKTDITWPYNGGTTSSTTLTSYAVPYTYSYKVSQTSDKFSAASQTYTAGQASRTISFILYPNNREFTTVADMEAYAYAWEGMKAYVGDTNYEYKNGEWVENQHSLPDVPFVLNYNARQYNASTHSIPMTTGQLNDTDAVAYNNPNNIVDHSADGYITISNSSMRIRKTNQDISLFNRQSNAQSSDLTIVCKAKTTNGENIITNRSTNYNWMYRLKPSGILTFHGKSETGSISWNTSNPDIMSVRTYYDSGTKLKYNNWTQNTSTSPTSFKYGSTNTDSSVAGALFVGYGWSNTNEQWSGDFYWVYMSQNTLTDEQVQQVIDYNENL